MLVLGIAHVALGAVGTLASCAFLLAGIALLVPAHLFAITSGPLAAFNTSHKVGTAVGIFVLGITHAIASVTLIVAGVRVFDVARSARKLSMLAAFLWTFANVVEFFAFSPPIWWFMAMNAYPVAVELLFLRTDWRAAFSGEDPEPAPVPRPDALPTAVPTELPTETRSE
jgi:hypothetical protein